MTLEQIYESIEKMNEKELRRLIFLLCNTINTQNDIVFDFKNKYIRLENNLNMIEDKLEKCKVYKSFCNDILDKIEGNPITAWWFLHSLKKKITQYDK